MPSLHAPLDAVPPSSGRRLRRPLATAGATALVGACLVGLPGTAAQAVDPVCTTTSYETFDSPLAADLTLNGNAAIVGADGSKVLRVTPAQLNQAGSSFTTNKVSFLNDGSFSTFFTFSFTEQQNGGADGLVFTVQNVSSSFGSPGGGIGYLGLGRSIGVEFDNWYNSGVDPLSANHVGIDLNGSTTSSPSAESPVTLDDPTALHRAWVDYNGATDLLEVRIADTGDRPAAALLTRTVDLPEVLGAGVPVTDAFVGFTSATGDAAAHHDVHSWTLSNCYQPIDAPPTVDAGGPYSGDEGSSVALTGSVTDDGTATSVWTVETNAADAGAACTFTDATSATTSVVCTDDGTYTLTLTGNDGVSAPVVDTATLTVGNAAPSLSSVSATFTEACTVSVTAAFSDPGSNDTHTGSIDWGDGTSGPATTAAPTASGSHTYTAAGTYTVTATVTDDDGGAGSDTASVTTQNTASGFGAPVGTDAERSVFRLGSTIPLKITVTDCSGDLVTTLTPTVELDRVDATPVGPVNAESVVEVPTNGKVMAWNGEHYHYNLSTRRSEFLGGEALTAGTYRITVSDASLAAPATVLIDLR